MSATPQLYRKKRTGSIPKKNLYVLLLEVVLIVLMHAFKPGTENKSSRLQAPTLKVVNQKYSSL